MVLASQALLRSWRTLPDVVLSYVPMTNPAGYPKKAAFTLYPRIFVEIPTHTVKHRNRNLDDVTAEAVLQCVRRRAHEIAAVPGWHAALLLANARFELTNTSQWEDAREGLFPHAYDLAVEYGPAEGRTDIAEVADRHMQQFATTSRAISKRSLLAVVANPEVRVELDAQLDQTWAQPLPERQPLTLRDKRATDSLFDTFGLASGKARAEANADALWAELLDSPSSDTRITALQLGLSTRPQPIRPPLDSSTDGAHGDAWRPIDVSILARLRRMLRDQTAVFRPELTARSAIEAEIGASVLPLGLTSTAARLTMALGGIAVSGLQVSVGAGDARPVARLDGHELPRGIREFQRKWRGTLRINRALTSLGTVHADTASYLEDPSTLYLKRLWGRVHTAGFSTKPIDSANAAWTHIYVSLHTASKNVGTITRHAIDRDVRDKPVDAQTASNESTDLALLMVLDIIEHVREEHPGEKIVEFYRWCVADAATELEQHETRWDAWCLSYLGEHSDQIDGLTGDNTVKTISDLPSLSMAVLALKDLAARTGGIGSNDEERDNEADEADDEMGSV